jgi:hypothetical protein
MGSAALGALVLGGRELLRRWSASRRSPRETPTVVFRTPVVDELGAPDSFDVVPAVAISVESLSQPYPAVADKTGPSPLADPTDRFSSQSLFDAQGPANDDPFEGDTLPFFDLESAGRTDTVADL